MKNVRQTEESRKQEAIEEVGRALQKWGQTPPAYVQIALQELIDLIPEDAEVTAARAEGLDTDSELARSKRRGRHDKKRAPAGYQYRSGELWNAGPGLVLGGTSPMRQIAASLVRTLEGRLNGFMREDELPRLEKAWEAITGYPWKYPHWAKSLVTALARNAKNAERDQLREQHGHREDESGYPWSGERSVLDVLSEAEILEEIQPAPSEVTTGVIGQLMVRVGLSARGRPSGDGEKKQTARQAVDHLLALLERGKSG